MSKGKQIFGKMQVKTQKISYICSDKTILNKYHLVKYPNMNLKKTSLLLTLALCLICLPVCAQENEQTMKLHAEMLRLISTSERDAFYQVTEHLKAECQKSGDERLFYIAWGNQSTYEATHQNYSQADEIISKIADYAQDQNSYWGNYVVLHTQAVNDLQKQDYDAAEAGFLKAVEFRHKYFPGESAGDDLQELMKIANHRKDQKAGLKYARQILAEPHVAPIHKGRALYRLSQFAFNKDNRELFDSIYDALMELKKTDGIGTVEPVVEVNHHIINGNYHEALRLSEQLSPESRAERKAIIYHRMGDDNQAYEYMSKFKKINDSIVLVSHGNVVASCFVQMNNERMKLEQQLLEDENARLRRQIIFIVVIAVLGILGLIIWQHRVRIRRLERENARLEKARKKAEKAFDMKNEFITQITNELREPLSPIEGFTDILGTKEYDLQPDEREQLSQHIHDSSKHITKIIDEMAELSYYESKKSLPIDYTLSPTHIFRHMVDSMRPRCKEGVRMFFETDLSDAYLIEQNAEALEALMTHLLNNAIQYTEKGAITVTCTEYGNMVRTSVTDMGRGISPEHQEHIFDAFIEVGESTIMNGLGLPICKAIVTLLGGKIWVDATYTEGSRFVFDIPRKNPYAK